MSPAEVASISELLKIAREYVQEAFDRKIEALRIDLQIAAILDALDKALESRS